MTDGKDADKFIDDSVAPVLKGCPPGCTQYGTRCNCNDLQFDMKAGTILLTGPLGTDRIPGLIELLKGIHAHVSVK